VIADGGPFDADRHPALSTETPQLKGGDKLEV
jgi:hypothetical protein